MASRKQTICDAPGSLVKGVLALIAEEPRGLIAVANKTNVPISWLRKFAGGKIPKPNANRVQHVYEKLSAKKIAL